MRKFLAVNNIEEFDLVRVRPDYYELTLEQRRDLLRAPTVDHLCKTVVMENTKHTGKRRGSATSPFPGSRVQPRV